MGQIERLEMDPGCGISRRAVLATALACLWGEAQGATGALDVLDVLEKRSGGRLGVAAFDTGNGRQLRHRGDERFPLCSTFKFVAVAAVLQRVDRGQEHLDRWIEFGPDDVLEYAPVSKQHVGAGGMMLADVCSAAVEWSDNTAANLLFGILGGPEGLTGFVRALGDDITRIDEIEPALNVVKPGEVHDTTTPSAMTGLLRAVLLGQVLSPDSRARLQEWMLDAKVGEHRVPAGLPAGWRIAHKTGTWDDQTNDVGLIWPPKRAPIAFAVYYTGGGELGRREAVLRDAGRIVAGGF